MCSNNIRRKVWPEGKGVEEVGLEVKMGLPEEFVEWEANRKS